MLLINLMKKGALMKINKKALIDLIAEYMETLDNHSKDEYWVTDREAASIGLVGLLEYLDERKKHENK